MEYTCFDVLLEQAQAAFHREKNLKNEAFLYIIQKGLFDDYGNWIKYRQGQKSGGEVHSECVAGLINHYCKPTAATDKKRKRRAMEK